VTCDSALVYVAQDPSGLGFKFNIVTDIGSQILRQRYFPLGAKHQNIFFKMCEF
jgi:hypothetical protein